MATRLLRCTCGCLHRLFADTWQGHRPHHMGDAGNCAKRQRRTRWFHLSQGRQTKPESPPRRHKTCAALAESMTQPRRSVSSMRSKSHPRKLRGSSTCTRTLRCWKTPCAERRRKPCQDQAVDGDGRFVIVSCEARDGCT